MAKRKAQQPAQGICRVCLCCAEEACDGGCGWADHTYTLCTACTGLTEDEENAKRAESLERLFVQHDLLVAEMHGLCEDLGRLAARIAVGAGARAKS
jgi:hypothetical protein